jgi:hypothetical protein
MLFYQLRFVTVNNDLSSVASLEIYVYLRMALYTAFVDLGRFSVSLIYIQLVGLLGWGISPSQGRFLRAE